MSEITAPRGEVTMPMRLRIPRQRTLARGLEQALFRQLLLELLEGKLQRAVAQRLERLRR